MLITPQETVTIEQLAEHCLHLPRSIKRIILHWTAQPYDLQFDDYHINIGKDGEIYFTCEDLADLKAHTWHRNSGSIGIALDCCENAIIGDEVEGTTPYIDWGPCPPTQKQIEAMAMVIAVLTANLGLDINEDTVFTHAEAAIWDGYGIGSNDREMRWDLLYLPDLPLTDKLCNGGRVMRGKALWYRNTLYYGSGRNKGAD